MQRADDVIPISAAPIETVRQWPAYTIQVALLLGGSLNGLAARIFEAGSIDGLALPLFGVSPIELFAIFVAAKIMLAVAAAARTPFGIAEGLAIAGMMLPSSTAAWLVTGSYALFLSLRLPLGSRAATGLFFGLAVSSLWSITVLKWLTIPITSFEAWVVAAILGFMSGDIFQLNNVVGKDGGHVLVILTACSALAGLPKVLLGVAAVALFQGPLDYRRLLVAAAVAAVVFILGNEIRLLLMAWSSDFYDVVHGPTGSNVYDLWQTLLVLVAGLGTSRR